MKSRAGENNPVKSHISTYLRIWLLVVVLFIQFFIVFVTRKPPIPASVHKLLQSPAAGGQCPLGKVYVYELPIMFNKDLADNCNDSDSFHWRCDAVSKGGFGTSATELAGIVPENLAPAWYRTSQFSLEVLFHNRLLNYHCRAPDPQSATAFYMPFYAGLAVGKYLWVNQSARDWHCEMLLKWVQDQPYWKRTNGSDHFITLGRITWDFRRLSNPEFNWGSSFINMPGMKNVTRFTIERAPDDEFDVGVPYPTGFHPRTETDVRQWQAFVKNQHRPHLFCFVGSPRTDIKNDFRSLLLSHCKTETGSCRAADCTGTGCSISSSVALQTFLGSDFCLQPRGDSYTRRSVFDCMIAGSIPVFFWNRTAYNQYRWFFPDKPESYSVFIDQKEVRNGTSIKEVLEKLRREEVVKMREKVIENIPKIVYAKTLEGLGSIEDAFDVAIHGVLKRINENRERMHI